MDDLANYDHHDYGFDSRADMVAYVEGSLSATQKAAREKSRGRFGIGNRKHNNSPQAAHSLGFGTGGDHQNRGVKKVRGAKEEVEMKSVTEYKTVGAKGGPALSGYELPRQLKNKKKEKMVGTKSGTKVVDRDDPKYKKHPEHEALDLKKIRAQRRAKSAKRVARMDRLAVDIGKRVAATDGHGGYAPDTGKPAHPSGKGAVKSDGPPGRPRGGKYKVHTKRIAKRYKDKAAGKDKKSSSSVSDAERVRASNALLSKLNTKKEALDTWHPDPEKDRKSTSMKHTAKAVRQHARRDKPATVARKKVTPDQIRDILAKQRARKAAQNEEIQFKVKIVDLPPFYVPGKSAGAVKTALRKQLRRPDDIESIERHTDAAKKKDFRLRAQGKQ